MSETVTVTLFVANLHYSTTEAELKDMFSPFGGVERAKLVYDRESGEPRGFGFVDIDADTAQDAIKGVSRRVWRGRAVAVKMAHKRPEQPLA